MRNTNVNILIWELKQELFLLLDRPLIDGNCPLVFRLSEILSKQNEIHKYEQTV